MARPLRIEYPGALYHVMARGNQGRPVFQDDADRQRFLDTLGQTCQKTGWRIHAYVLMGNHYHLLVETPEGNLVAGMKWLQGTYTQRHNRRHRVFGHLFQGRYKAVIVDAQEGKYFQVVSTYIHLNPARAGLIRIGQEPLKRFRWSSYPWYAKGSGRGPEWLCRERVMGSLGLAPRQSRGYEAYMEGRMLELGSQGGRKQLEQEWRQLRRGWFMGRQSFLESLEERLEGVLNGKRRESHSGPPKQAHDEAAAERILRQGCKVLGRVAIDLGGRPGPPKGAPEKVALAWWLRRRTTVSLRWVSERLAMGHYSRVAQAVSRMERQPGRKLEQMKQRLLESESTRV